MKPLFTGIEYENTKPTQKLPCKCYQCGKSFLVQKKMITHGIKHNKNINLFCSNKCRGKSNENLIDLNCENCDKLIKKKKCEYIRTKHHFCSSSCAATYNNTHKKQGTRISKLEKWLEFKLNEEYPDLEIHYNRKDTINSELDIYIPTLNLAFELNGIFHYEPIFGDIKLYQTKNNDERKFQACLEKGIELCIIDTSEQIYFKEQTSIKYLTIINDIINKRLLIF